MQKRHLMVVDDKPEARRGLEAMLIAAGYSVSLAENGKDALRILQMVRVDGFVLDIDMPEMDGLDLCHELRKREDYATSPIIFVTSKEEAGRRKQAIAAGADDFITEPVDPVILGLRLSNLLQRMDLVNNLKRTQRYLNRYISPRTREMVDVYSTTGVMPAPEEHELCVMFCDIRGFTALTQQIPPGILFDMLSMQLAIQTDLVFQHGGYIDNTSGDGQMAVFEGTDKAVNACRCALAIMASTRRQIDAPTNSHMTIGIGINMGTVLIGNIGSRDHLDYSAIGTTVNVAARLCGIAERMSIIVSQPVYETASRVPELHFSSPEQTSIRGIQQPLSIYQLTE